MPPPVPRSPVFGIEALANGPHRLGCIEREAQKAREVAEELGELGDERVLVPPGCVLHDRHPQEAGEFSDEMPGVLISESEMPEMAQPKIRAVFEAEPDVEPIVPRLAVRLNAQGYGRDPAQPADMTAADPEPVVPSVEHIPPGSEHEVAVDRSEEEDSGQEHEGEDGPEEDDESPPDDALQTDQSPPDVWPRSSATRHATGRPRNGEPSPTRTKHASRTQYHLAPKVITPDSSSTWTVSPSTENTRMMAPFSRGFSRHCNEPPGRCRRPRSRRADVTAHADGDTGCGATTFLMSGCPVPANHVLHSAQKKSQPSVLGFRPVGVTTRRGACFGQSDAPGRGRALNTEVGEGVSTQARCGRPNFLK